MNFFILLGALLIISIIFNVIIYINNVELLKINDNLISLCDEVFVKYETIKKASTNLLMVLEKNNLYSSKDVMNDSGEEEKKDDSENKKTLH